MSAEQRQIPDWAKYHPSWPNPTPLQEKLQGKRWHHDPHCNSWFGGPMGCDGCSCVYRKR